ncbi:MAG: hypothetical protein CMB31_07040 [Euryarchaeota archaeon]|nr:hypothetical protein [Euryarchaeota archaeon]
MAKVAMIVSNPCNPDPRVEKEAKSLISEGHEVTIHAFDRAENVDETQSNIAGVKIQRYRVGFTPMGAGSIFSGIKILIGLRKFRQKVLQFLVKNPPEIIHCHDADTIAIGIKLKEKQGTKLIFDMHDLAHTWARMDNPNSIIRKLISKKMEKNVVKHIRKCDLIVVSSGSISEKSNLGFREWIINHVPNQDVIVVENRPISISKIPPLPKKFTIGYAGIIREISMFENLFQTIENWPEEEKPRILIAGHGAADAKLDELINHSDLDIIRKHKFQSSEIDGIITEISVMFAVYPTTRGNILDGALPTKMFDAAKLGRPSIVNSGCLMSDIAEEENLGISIDQNDSSALMNALMELKQQPMNVELERDWTNEVKQLINAYSILENHS